VKSFGKLIALLEDVVGQVVNWVRGTNPPHIDHALRQHRDDCLHQELPHVQLLVLLQVGSVGNQRFDSAVSEGFQRVLFLLLGKLLRSLFLLVFSDGVFFLFLEVFFTLLVEVADGAQVVVGTTVALNVDSHRLEHFKQEAFTVDFEDLSLVFLVEPEDWKRWHFVAWQSEVWVVVSLDE